MLVESAIFCRNDLYRPLKINRRNRLWYGIRLYIGGVLTHWQKLQVPKENSPVRLPGRRGAKALERFAEIKTREPQGAVPPTPQS